jgi:hypothetical protein
MTRLKVAVLSCGAGVFVPCSLLLLGRLFPQGNRLVDWAGFLWAPGYCGVALVSLVYRIGTHDTLFYDLAVLFTGIFYAGMTCALLMLAPKVRRLVHK